MRLKIICLLVLGPALAWADQPDQIKAPVKGQKQSWNDSSSAGSSIQRLDLYQAINIALHWEPQVTANLIQSERAELALKRAKLDQFSLKIDANLGEQWQASNFWRLNSDPELQSLGTVTGGSGLFNFSSNLQVPLFSGYRVSANINRARHLHNAGQAAIQVTARDVALQVLRAYWNVRRAEILAEVSERALKRYDDAVVVVKARVNAGLAPAVDLNRIETRLVRERARWVDYTRLVAEGKAQLAVALGLGGKTIVLTEAATIPDAFPSAPQDVDRWLGDAKKLRPELRAARSQSLAAAEQIRISRSEYFPQLNAFMQFQYGNYALSSIVTTSPSSLSDQLNPLNNASGIFTVGALLSINLFDTWRTKTLERDARYELAWQQQEERRLGVLIESEVRTTHARLVGLYNTRDTLLKALNIAKDTLDIIERRYQNGDALILDFLDAQFERLNAEADVADSAVAISQTWGELWVATGRMPRSSSRRGVN